MKKKNFPAVQAISPSKTLQLLGIDEGTILRYNTKTGMYVANEQEEDIGPGQSYKYFAETVGFSKAVIEALLEAGGLKEVEQDIEEEDADKADIEEAENMSEEGIEQWEFAEMFMVCGRCGEEEKITDAVGGATIFMPTNSASETRLVCKRCGNKMSLLYRNGRDLTEEERAEVEKMKNNELEVPEFLADQPATVEEAFEKIEQDESQEKSD